MTTEAGLKALRTTEAGLKDVYNYGSWFKMYLELLKLV
jgi:hypothetical protein